MPVSCSLPPRMSEGRTVFPGNDTGSPAAFFHSDPYVCSLSPSICSKCFIFGRRSVSNALSWSARKSNRIQVSRRITSSTVFFLSEAFPFLSRIPHGRSSPSIFEFLLSLHPIAFFANLMISGSLAVTKADTFLSSSQVSAFLL